MKRPPVRHRGELRDELIKSDESFFQPDSSILLQSHEKLSPLSSAVSGHNKIFIGLENDPDLT